MFQIVGHRIYVHEKDNCSFICRYKDARGAIHDFTSTDILTIYVKDRESKDVLLQKTSTPIDIRGNIVNIISFTPQDYKCIPVGDYIYELSLENEAGATHTLIDRADMHILTCTASNRMSIHAGNDVVCVSSTPLICRYDYVPVDMVGVPGTLIPFDILLGDDDEQDLGSIIIF